MSPTWIVSRAFQTTEQLIDLHDKLTAVSGYLRAGSSPWIIQTTESLKTNLSALELTIRWKTGIINTLGGYPMMSGLSSTRLPMKNRGLKEQVAKDQIDASRWAVTSILSKSAQNDLVKWDGSVSGQTAG